MGLPSMAHAALNSSLIRFATGILINALGSVSFIGLLCSEHGYSIAEQKDKRELFIYTVLKPKKTANWFCRFKQDFMNTQMLLSRQNTLCFVSIDQL